MMYCDFCSKSKENTVTVGTDFIICPTCSARRHRQDAYGRTQTITLKEAKAQVKALGYRLEYVADLYEYCVFTPYAARDAYYTDDRQDAVDTAKAMARRRDDTIPPIEPGFFD